MLHAIVITKNTGGAVMYAAKRAQCAITGGAPNKMVGYKLLNIDFKYRPTRK